MDKKTVLWLPIAVAWCVLWLLVLGSDDSEHLAAGVLMGNGQPFCLCPALAPERGSRVSAAPVSLGAHGPAGGCRTVATSCRLAQRVWRESQSYSLCSSL